MDPNLIERLERIRRDPQFEEYIKFKEKWKNELKNAKPAVIQQHKHVENHLKYISMLVKKLRN